MFTKCLESGRSSAPDVHICTFDAFTPCWKRLRSTGPARAPKGFRLADHVREDRRFSYPVSDRKLELKAVFDAGVAVHLTETRMAPDHRTTVQEDGRVLVEATVPDTADLRWWLLGFGASVEVAGPALLREEFREQAQRLGAKYHLLGTGVLRKRAK